MTFNLENFRVKNAPNTIYYIPDFITAEEEQILWNKVYTAPCTKWTVLSHRRLQNWGGLPGPKGMVAEDMPKWLNSFGHRIAELGIFESRVPNHVLVNEYEAGQGIMPHEDGPAFYPTVSTITLGSHTLLDFYYHLGHSPDGAGGLPLNTVATAAAITMSSGDVSESQLLQASFDQQQHNVGSGVVKTSIPNKEEKDTEPVNETSFQRRYFLSLLLQPRSLVVVQDDMYKVHLHGIKETKEDLITERVANLHMVPQVSLGDVLERSTRISLTMRFVPKVLRASLIFGKR